MITKYFNIIFLCTIFFGCKKSDHLAKKQKFEIAIKFAGDNAEELLKVINHYNKNENDSLKLKSAYFLIENITGHYAYAGNKVKALDSFISRTAMINQQQAIDSYQQQINTTWDSIFRDANQYNIPAKYVFDNKVISSALLIENIDCAFEAWKLPWSKHLTFDEFSQYVLPYRFYDEPLESWRPIFMRKFSWLKDSMGSSTDPVKACELINRELQRTFKFNAKLQEYPAALGPKNLLRGMIGKCVDQAGIANFAMRAMGIPVVMEEIPRWANRSMGHVFSSVLRKDGKFIDFLGASLSPYQNEMSAVAPKIYRNLYAIQSDNQLAEDVQLGSIGPNYERFVKDVTHNYVPVADIRIKVKSGVVKPNQNAYLCIFDDRNWSPVLCIGALKNSEVVFKDVGLGAVYLPVVFSGTGYVPISAPVLLNLNGKITLLQPNLKNTEEIVLNRKYPMSDTKSKWLGLMTNGEFEGANMPNFSDVKRLFIIPWIFSPKYYKSKITDRAKYRYVRYRFPSHSFGSLAEVGFYQESTNQLPLKGKLISSEKVNPRDLNIAFDGNTDNFINTQNADDYNGEWIGIDLGKRFAISDIAYCPRNDGNSIKANNNYEFFYWDRKWVSLGHEPAKTDNQLVYKNVPKGALLLLRNLTQGKEERIFTYENNQQVWW